jgi:hypothetical protein
MVTELVASVARIRNRSRTAQKPVRSNCTRTCLRVDRVGPTFLERGKFLLHHGEKLRVHQQIGGGKGHRLAGCDRVLPPHR